MTIFTVIYILIFVIFALIAYAVLQIKLFGMKVKDFWSFIEKYGTKSTSYSFEKMQSTRNRYTIKYDSTCFVVLQIEKDSSKHLSITIINKDKFISVYFSSLIIKNSFTFFEIHKNIINTQGLQLFNDEYDYVCYEFDTDLVNEIYDILK